MLAKTHNRKFFRADPFESAKRGLQTRLRHIEAQILSRFPAGVQRELMRGTIHQLLEREETMLGKIQRLIAVVEQGEWELEGLGMGFGLGATTCTDGGRSELSQGKLGHREVRKRSSQLFSPLAGSSHNYPQGAYDQNPRFYTENQEQSKENSPSYSYQASRKDSFSRLESMRASSALEAEENEQSPSLKKGNSALNLYESVPAGNHKDLFSFRTQKEEQSPMHHLGQSKHSHHKEPSVKSGLKRSKNQSKEDMIQYSQKSSKSSLRLSRSKSKKKSTRNYDGTSQLYAPSFSPSNSKVSKKSRLSPNRKKIYQKIFNRLKYSSCVMDSIQHTNSPATAAALQNRFRLESESRSELAVEIGRRCEDRQNWRW